MGQFSLLPQQDLEDLLRPKSLGFLQEQPPVKTTVENFTDQQGQTDQRVTQVSTSLPQTPADDTSSKGNAWTLLTDMDDREKEILSYATKEANKLRQMDSVLGTNRGDALMTKVLQRLKLERTNVEDATDRMLSEEFYTNESFPQAIQKIAEQGATTAQMGKFITAWNSANPQMGAKMQQALFAAQSSYDSLPDDQKRRLLAEGIDEARYVNREAANLIVEWNTAAGTSLTINEAKVENASLINIHKALNKDILEIYNDPQGTYRNASNDLDRINYAIKLMTPIAEGGAGFETGPLTKPWMLFKRFVNQAFSGGSDEQRNIIGESRKFADRFTDINIADAEFLNSLYTLLGARNIALTKGNVTEREMKLFLSIAPELNKSPEGNLFLLKILKNINQKTVDWHRTAMRYFTDVSQGWPKDPKAWTHWMSQQPDVLKWLNYDEQGVGGVIPREAFAKYSQPVKPKAGLKTEEGKEYDIVGDVIGVSGQYGAPNPIPFFYEATGLWFIRNKDGFLQEIQFR